MIMKNTCYFLESYYFQNLFLKICQQSTLNMPKLPYTEIFSGYEIWIRTLQQPQKCINSLKIVNSKSIHLKVLSKLYSLQCTKLIRLGTM